MDANKTIRPEEHLRAVSKKYLLAWQQLAMFRAERGKDDLPAWPDWCYCPVAGAYAIVSSGGALPPGSLQLELHFLHGQIVKVRATQQRYLKD